MKNSYNMFQAGSQSIHIPHPSHNIHKDNIQMNDIYKVLWNVIRYSQMAKKLKLDVFNAYTGITPVGCGS